MKFLIDAQLPRRMARWLADAGCDVVHTLDLPDGNRTKDEKINEIARRDDRVVVTKDADFVSSHLLYGHPPKLLLISTGNISNQDLIALLQPIVALLSTESAAHNFLELGRSGLVARD